MIVIAAAVLGAVLGDRRARVAGGGIKDRLQYAAVHMLILGIPALFVSILFDRAMRG